MFLIKLVAPLLVAAILIYEYIFKRRSATLPNIPISPEELLKFSELINRALPNRNLADVFHLENSFTTCDAVYNKEFVRKVTSLFKLASSNSNLMEIGQDASSYAKEYISGWQEKDVDVVPMVQRVVLHTVLKILFPDLSMISNQHLNNIPAAINRLWLLSKSSLKVGTEQHSNDWKVLEKALNGIFNRPATHSMKGRDNELNWILPAYETLWRIVLRCFLEVRFRISCPEKGDWRKLLQEFLSNPDISKLQKSTKEPEMFVSSMVKEGLRLYPPTRRIYRQMEKDGPIHVVDVEFLHRDPKIWGVDSLVFKPARWMEDEVEPENSYLPFGWGEFRCPARHGFGAMLIGILVAALDDAVGDEYSLKDENGRTCIEGIKPLQGGREVYAELCLVKQN